MLKRLKGIITIMALLILAALALAWFLGYFDADDVEPRLPAGQQAPPTEQAGPADNTART